jgi:nitrite reductase/ring-hydroxylating ferredoxin subunit
MAEFGCQMRETQFSDAEKKSVRSYMHRWKFGRADGYSLGKKEGPTIVLNFNEGS